MKAQSFGEWLDRVCTALFVVGLVLLAARALHLIAWPWWCVLLPSMAWLAVHLGTLFFILVVAAVEECRSASRRRRERERQSFHFEL